MTTLLPTYRLDRLTSGVVILAKNSMVAKEFQERMTKGECQKTYVARVKGKFPDPEELSARSGSPYKSTDGTLNALSLVITKMLLVIVHDSDLVHK